MEEHRLTPMGDYDPQVFNEIYKATEQLRKKLAWQIDSRKYGVDYKEILSWFDVKFLFAFNKYFPVKEKEELKAHVIQALQFFKNRILRKGYSKSNIYNSMVDIEIVYNLKETQIDFEYDEQQFFLNKAMTFLKDQLSQEAYQVLQVEITPPLYIIQQLANQDKYTTTKIPSSMISDYLGWGVDGIKKVDDLRSQIKKGINIARSYYYESESILS